MCGPMSFDMHCHSKLDVRIFAYALLRILGRTKGGMSSESTQCDVAGLCLKYLLCS